MREYEQVYRRYFKDIYLYLYSLTRDTHLAEELTAETFARAVSGIKAFRGECDVRVWLCQIAKNCFYAHAKKQKRHIPLEDAPPVPAASPSPADPIEDRDTARRLHILLHTLPEPYKEVFTLRVFCELPFGQIAALFGKTESWARVTYHRARQKLLNALTEQEEEHGL